MPGYACQTCGRYHDDLPMSFGASEPIYTANIAGAERDDRVVIDDDLCVLDGEQYFIHGCLNIALIDAEGPFTWGVWVSLSAKSYQRVVELWGMEGQESEPPYFGWLSTELPGYPSTLNLKTHVHTAPVGTRPFIELEPTGHPLAVEQRNGIKLASV